jgi:hypothetical protein
VPNKKYQLSYFTLKEKPLFSENSSGINISNSMTFWLTLINIDKELEY